MQETARTYAKISVGTDYKSAPAGSHKPIERLNLFNPGMLNLTNETFRNFRTKTGIGTDFRIKEKKEINNNIQTIKIYENGVEYQ